MCYYNVSRHVASNLNIKSDADEALLDSQDQYLHKPKNLNPSYPVYYKFLRMIWSPDLI